MCMTTKYKQDWRGPRPSPVEFVSQFDIPVEPAVKKLRPQTAPRDAWTPHALHPPRLLVWAVSIRPDSMPVARKCPRPERCADAPVPFHVDSMHLASCYGQFLFAGSDAWPCLSPLSSISPRQGRGSFAARRRSEHACVAKTQPAVQHPRPRVGSERQVEAEIRLQASDLSEAARRILAGGTYCPGSPGSAVWRPARESALRRGAFEEPVRPNSPELPRLELKLLRPSLAIDVDESQREAARRMRIGGTCSVLSPGSACMRSERDWTATRGGCPPDGARSNCEGATTSTGARPKKALIFWPRPIVRRLRVGRSSRARRRGRARLLPVKSEQMARSSLFASSVPWPRKSCKKSQPSTRVHGTATLHTVE